MSAETFGRYNAEVEDMFKRRSRLALRQRRRGAGKHLKSTDRNGNVLTRPNGLRETVDTLMLGRGSGPVRQKKEVYQ